MRKIKFRAFVKNMKWLLPVTEIHFGECGYVEVDYTGEGDYADYDFNEVQLTQFTGLKDKNGREIYTGDILEFNNCASDRTGGYVSDEIVKRLVHYDAGAYWVDGILLIDAIVNDEENEVVGNVFENPELLEGTT